MSAIEDDRFKPWAEPVSGVFMAGMLVVLIVGTTVSAALGGCIAARERA